MDEQARARGLAEALLSGPDPRPDCRHAIVDGGRFDDLSALLQSAGIQARSLFLDAGDRKRIEAGPFLARLDPAALPRFLAIPEIATACVFWLGPIEEGVLFHHLRGLNLIELPRPRTSGDVIGPATETVLFRHWDPSVMAMTFRVLEPAQRARVMGPAAGLLLSDDGGQARLGTRRTDWPEPARGRLRLSPQQLAAMDDAVIRRSHRAIAGYLRSSAPEQTRAMNDAALHRFVRHAEADGRSLGLSRERALGQFCYVSLVGGGQVERLPQTRRFLMHGPGRADERMDQLMRAMAAEAGRRTGAPA